ncbi:MAG: hypothetical protein K8F53_07410 [Rhodocyclaceae bacterium]|nr:hypothetical protein [Rhodocyclaceae bacterium]
MAKHNDDEKEQRVQAPTMDRARGQLSSAYAPGAFFTFEGGLGTCVALPDRESGYLEAAIGDTVRKQILSRFEEAVISWFSRAIRCRGDAPKHQIKPALCVEELLLSDDYKGIKPIDRGRFIFLNPVKMGYVPAPMTFVCNTCKMFRQFSGVKATANAIGEFDPCRCPNPKQKGKCQWRQLDVVFVHWSGHWEPVIPGKWDWNTEKKELREPINRCPLCHGDDFTLDTSSPSIGKWFFKCANPNCGHIEENSWLKNDPDTIKVLGNDFPARISEARMEPVSSRASSAFYAQSEQFILFDAGQDNLLAALDPSQSSRLAEFIAEKFGYGRARPTIDEMGRLLCEGGHSAEWQTYLDEQRTLETAKTMGPSAQLFIEQFEKNLQARVDRWFRSEPPLLRETNELPPIVQATLADRGVFSSRYDPFRLAVEHEALRRNKLQATKGGSCRSAFVRFDALDQDLAPNAPGERKELEGKTRKLLDRLGIKTMGLIREFDLCRFTYGYSRVQSVPAFEKRNEWMPVKLNLFPSVQTPDGGGRRPIYVITQANEAIYVKLDEREVFKWLQKVGPSDMIEWPLDDAKPLGAHLLERTVPFGRFLQEVRPKKEPRAYLYAYTLLHTMSHMLMKAVAEHSGLDLGSLGEYIFPADLAFVVYRNGTTMDLGNLSSLWRNENERFLRYLLEPKTLSCNSGSLCAKHGGACPDCILVPETSCIAMNQLLSRSVLRGGDAPREDGQHEFITGFLQSVNEHNAA